LDESLQKIILTISGIHIIIFVIQRSMKKKNAVSIRPQQNKKISRRINQ